MEAASNFILAPGQFNGYTNYWHSVYWEWFRYGNLYQVSRPDVSRSILQKKIDLAEELGVSGLDLQEGFLDGLLNSAFRTLHDPSLDVLEQNLTEANVLVYIHPSGDLGKKLLAKAAARPDWRRSLRSHQLFAGDFHDVPAFYLEDGARKLFVVATECAACRTRLKQLIEGTLEIVRRFDLHRGWFGAGTLLHSVTCHPGHPLEVIGQGVNQGNDWFTFSGYMDYLLRGQLSDWLSKVGLDVVTDVGTGKATHSFGSIAFGCRDWEGLKIQDMPTEEEWIRYVKDRGGHIFRPVFSAECNSYTYDGYIAIEGNKKQIDTEDIPFILMTGYVREEAPACMVLFTDKGIRFSRETMWEAILGRRGVGVLPQGKMLGPEAFRSVLEMLLLDRIYLESYFGDMLQIEARVEGHELRISLGNAATKPLAGTLEVITPAGLEIKAQATRKVSLGPLSSKTIILPLRPTLEAMGRTNPILVNFSWASAKKRTLAIMDLPRPISAHQLLYGQSPEVVYPVSIHNFSEQESYPVALRVFEAENPSKVVFETSQQGKARSGEFEEVVFRLPLRAGAYRVEVSALGARNVGQLGVEKAGGNPRAYEVDLNGDGINEFRLENDRVLVTLLSTGARIIEYIVKERQDNILFKLWPEKEKETARRPFRERGFYPYGGFEDFLGQASMETHKVYDAELLKKDGGCVQVRMTADYYGNRLEKIFTLYGDSPLVEVRFSLTFRNPEANMLGPQPILELGKRHWTEDVFAVPSCSGLREFRMRPEEYFGEVIFLKEGWNAGYDSEADISFVGAFPVSEPEFLHMWMNHPSNAESHHYYAEFQPWVPIYQKTVRYFSYYLWAAAGKWQDALMELRRRNLITTLH
ncbi:MAG: hypothetical protein AB1715_00345 [Acidobacteriota bacterium]